MPLSNDEELLRQQTAAEIERLRVTRQELQQQVDGLGERLTRELAAQQAQIAQLEKRREALKAEVGQLVLDHTQWARQLQDAREAFRKESVRHDALRAAITDGERRAAEVETLDRDIETRRAIVQALTAEHLELVGAVEDAKGTLATIQETKIEQERVQQHLGQTMKTMAAEKQELEAVSRQCIADRAAMDLQLEALRVRKAELDAQEHRLASAQQRREAAEQARLEAENRFHREMLDQTTVQEAAQRAIDERAIQAEAHLKAAQDARQEALGQLRAAQQAEEGVRAREAAVEAQEALLRRREAALEEQRQKLRVAGAELAARARASRLGVSVPTVE